MRDNGRVEGQDIRTVASAKRAMLRHLAPSPIGERPERAAGFLEMQFNFLDIRELLMQGGVRLLHAHKGGPRNERTDIVKHKSANGGMRLCREHHSY
jgi:hypothetical protein